MNRYISGNAVFPVQALHNSFVVIGGDLHKVVHAKQGKKEVKVTSRCVVRHRPSRYLPICTPQSHRRDTDCHRLGRVMEGVFYELDTETQFWAELDEILSPVATPTTELSVETAVRNFVRFAAAFRCTPSLPFPPC